MRNIRFGRKYDINEINYFSERNGEKLIADSENRMSFDILGAAGGIIDAGESLKAEFTLACNFGWKMPKETAEDGEKAQSGVILMPEVQDESHT